MRSGSNNLQDSLNNHPEIECGGEVFNPGHLQIWSKVYREDQKASAAQILGLKAAVVVARCGKRWFPEMMLRIARRPLGKDMFGFRLFGDHVDSFGLNPLLEKLHARGAKFIHLVRRDTFDQALSLVRAQALVFGK
jgi:LPS sulfotransferase NodH